jgi:hypothetical protein
MVRSCSNHKCFYYEILETKLKCLIDAKKIFGPILLGKACQEEVDDFMAFGVNQNFDISDEEITT